MAIPPRPKRMSKERYRELYDSEPQIIEIPGARFKCRGAISAEVVAKTYRDKGIPVTIRPAK